MTCAYRCHLCVPSSRENQKNSRRLELSISKNTPHGRCGQGPGSVVPRFPAGLPFPVPEILEFVAFRDSGKFSGNFPGTFPELSSRTRRKLPAVRQKVASACVLADRTGCSRKWIFSRVLSPDFFFSFLWGESFFSAQNKLGRREKTPTPKTRVSIWSLLRTPSRFTTRPLPVHFTTKMSAVRPFSVLSNDEIGP